MKFLLHTVSRIELRISFIIASVFIIALGYIEQFFILFISVTLHELAHIAVARFFHLRTQKIIFSALGLAAVIKTESVTSAKRIAIFLAGPLMSLTLFLFASIFFIYYPHISEAWRNVNMALLLLNILPVYPLDGGRILRQLLARLLGVIPGNWLSMVIGRFISILIICVGCIQVVLYPYNISLICIGFYIIKSNSHERLHMTLSFYTSLIDNELMKKNHILPVKIFAAQADCSIKSAINRFIPDHFHLVHVIDRTKTLYTLTESEIISYIIDHGFVGTLEDVLLEVYN